MIEVAYYFAGSSWEKKIVGTGTDGVSTMLGKNKGFLVKLRQGLDRPELVAVHCSAHRNELAYKDAARGIQLYKKVDALLLCTSSIRTAPSTGAASNKLLMRSERPTIFRVESVGHVGFPIYQKQFPMC